MANSSVFAKLATAMLVAALPVAVVGDLLVDGLAPVVIGVALAVGGLGMIVLDSVAAPTPGKLLWVLGVGLIIAPVAAGNVPLLPAEVPAETIVAGLVVLVAAYAQRVREVDMP